MRKPRSSLIQKGGFLHEFDSADIEGRCWHSVEVDDKRYRVGLPCCLQDPRSQINAEEPRSVLFASSFVWQRTVSWLRCHGDSSRNHDPVMSTDLKLFDIGIDDVPVGGFDLYYSIVYSLFERLRRLVVPVLLEVFSSARQPLCPSFLGNKLVAWGVSFLNSQNLLNSQGER